jgi:hypothetical protein
MLTPERLQARKLPETVRATFAQNYKSFLNCIHFIGCGNSKSSASNTKQVAIAAVAKLLNYVTDLQSNGCGVFSVSR